mmetsp:Transcript_22001/g.46405  ORF Transcript_22001/g.46405 Transcript_22001/m.46405 type:complete len:355 (-) Transcript_22001:230-1294(-)
MVTTPNTEPTSAASTRMPRRVSVSDTGNDVVARLPKEQNHFPFKLYDMLEYASDSEYCSSVSWVQNGHAFVIHNKEAFLEHIVPRFFKQTKFRSFTRQLNLWGFTRIAMECPDKGAWKHEHFVRGNIERLRSIQRIEIKNGKLRTKTEKRQPRKSKTKQRQHGLRIPKVIEPRVASPAESTDGSSFSVSHAGKILSRSPDLLNLDEPLHPMHRPLISNRNFRPQLQHETFSDSDHFCQLSPIISSSCIPTGSQTQFQISPNQNSFNLCNMDMMSQHQPMSFPREINMALVHRQNPVQPPAKGSTNEEDLLFLLSDIFDSDDNPQDDDLSSILSVNEAPVDIIDHISFFNAKESI